MQGGVRRGLIGLGDWNEEEPAAAAKLMHAPAALKQPRKVSFVDARRKNPADKRSSYSELSMPCTHAALGQARGYPKKSLSSILSAYQKPIIE